jgi:diguanylate cyclase (GGDEF)-like protein
MEHVRPRVWIAGMGDEVLGACRLLDAKVALTWVESVEEALPRLRDAGADLLVVCSSPSRPATPAMLLRVRIEAEALGLPWAVLEPEHDEASAVAVLHAGGEYVHSRMGPAEIWARMARRMAAWRRDRELEEQAQTDSLTGLANFRALTDRLQSELKRAHRYGYPLCAVMLDVDHLKQINDRHGHEVGNQAIAMLARHLATHVRETDFVARFGGDEFTLVLPHHDAGEARLLSERLQSGLQQLRGPQRLVPYEVNFSAGIAEYPGEAPPPGPSTLLDAADEALRTAKRAGRARVLVSGPPRPKERFPSLPPSRPAGA